MSLFSASDAEGPWRRIYLGGLSCNLLSAPLSGALPGLGSLPLPIQLLVSGIVSNLGDAGVCAK